MKKSILIGLFCAFSAGAYAQGTILFADRSSSTVQYFHIYAPQQSGLAVSGYSSIDTPPGSTVYDTGSLLGGASGAAGGPFTAGSPVYGYGNLFDVEIYALAGTGDSLSSLLPVSQYFSTMQAQTKSGTLGTFITPNIASDPGIPNTPVASPSATVAVAAWYNAGGTITSLAAAISAGVPYGESVAVNITDLGEGSASPPSTAPNLESLIPSFSLVNPVSSTPEPGTIALGLMGVCGFLARRRNA